MSIEETFDRIADALERIADALERNDAGDGDQAGEQPRPRVRRQRIADRVEWWKANHPTWATDPIPSQGEIIAATGIASADSISKIRRMLMADQEAAARVAESS